MGFSKLRIPKLCEYCQKPFEAKTITTRFCCKECARKLQKKIKKQEKEQQETDFLLSKYKMKIAELQCREYISVSEATMLYGVSKDTVYRMIRKGVVLGINLGERLTRVRKSDFDNLFIGKGIEEEKKEETEKEKTYDIKDCYTLSEVSKKYNANPSTVTNAIRKYNIPKQKIGSFVYVPKEKIDQIFNLI